jgi:hypothetical protein
MAATADAIGATVYSSGLSAATIRRLACDANVVPIVLGSNSEPLDVGRSERLVTRAIRRALNTRDRGCVVCGAPPIMCDAHHLTSWIDGGDTKTTNLVLLCRRHHTDLHNGHWIITITNGEVHVTRPTWADPPDPHQNTAPPPPPPRSTPDHRPPRGRPLRNRPPDRSAPDDPAPDRLAPDCPAADLSEVDHSADGEGVAGDLWSGGDGGSLRPHGPAHSVPEDSVAPAATGLKFAASDGRVRDEALSASAQDDEAVRHATYLAIWGERPPTDRTTRSAHRLSDSAPFDPWGGSDDLSPATTAPDPP